MSDQSTRKPTRSKSKAAAWKKPYADFPLSYHPASHRLYKTIKGRRYYFGYGRDKQTTQAAVDRYLAERDDLYAGRKPRRAKAGAMTCEDLCNLFMANKESRLASGELTRRSYDDYYRACKRVLDAFGKARAFEDLNPDDWGPLREKMAKTLGPVSLAGEINRIRAIGNYATKNDLVTGRVRYGTNFDRPTKLSLRLERAKNGSKMFEAVQIRQLLKFASEHMQAMILLAVNGGLGNSDCAQLQMRHLDLNGGWLDYPRPKTGIDRRIPLWPVTVEALRVVIAHRREPKDACDKHLVFLTRCGESWAKYQTTITHEFGKLMQAVDDSHAKQAKKNGTETPPALRGSRRNFYALRHVFETVGGASRDQVAVNHVMGHADASMAGVYRERIDDERLRAVADHVRTWLFGADMAKNEA